MPFVSTILKVFGYEKANASVAKELAVADPSVDEAERIFRANELKRQLTEYFEEEMQDDSELEVDGIDPESE